MVKYLAGIVQGNQKMTQEECQFCHIQEAPEMIEKGISAKVYFIQEIAYDVLII
jgi:hypothetical protein